MVKRTVVRIGAGKTATGSVSAAFGKSLVGLGKRLRAKAIDDVETAAGVILERARDFAPTDTGALANSGKIETEITKGRVTTSVVFGGSTDILTNEGKSEVDYALFVHEVWRTGVLKGKTGADWGAGPKSRNRNPNARPQFLLAALDDAREDFFKELGRRLNIRDLL